MWSDYTSIRHDVSGRVADMGRKKHPTEGPRGGKTTVSTKSGLIRKTLWIHWDENEALRRAAFEQNTTETDIVRRLLRKHFRIED